MENKLKNKNYFLPCLILGISLSTAGSMMSLISISTLLFKLDVSGTFSSYLQIVTLLGVVVTGVFGGSLISKMTSTSIGFLMPIISAIVLGFLLFFEITFLRGLTTIFLLSCLYGVEHPNNIRTLNNIVAKEKKASIFSLFQTISQSITMFAPLLTAFIITTVGIRPCIIIDIITCLISGFIWLLFRPDKKSENKECKVLNVCHGYRLLAQDQHIRNLNLARIINNISFITFTVGLPIFISRLVQGNTIHFTHLQGYTGSGTAIAFTISGVFGTFLLKKHPKNIFFLTMLASVLGFFAVVLEYFALSDQLLIVASIILGIGQYCFRISGITLGQFITPTEYLGQVIIAGDTVVRLFSFLFALTVPYLIEISHKSAVFPIICIAALTLLAPLMLRNISRMYHDENSLIPIEKSAPQANPT